MPSNIKKALEAGDWLFVLHNSNIKFERDHMYRIKETPLKSVICSKGVFSGAILIFREEAYNHYDGYTAYLFFSLAGSSETIKVIDGQEKNFNQSDYFEDTGEI